MVECTVSRYLSNNGHCMRKLSLSTSFSSVRPRIAHTYPLQLTELAIDLDESKFNAVAKGADLEVPPYLANAHALEPTSTPSVAGSPTPGSGKLTLRE